MKDICNNLSAYVREAIEEALEEDFIGLSKTIPGMRVVTVNLEYAQEKLLKTLKENEKICSVSEYGRNAVERKFIRDKKVLEFVRKHNSNPNKIYVPIGNHEFKTYKLLREA